MPTYPWDQIIIEVSNDDDLICETVGMLTGGITRNDIELFEAVLNN